MPHLAVESIPELSAMQNIPKIAKNHNVSMIVDDPLMVVHHAMVHSIDIFCAHLGYLLSSMYLNF